MASTCEEGIETISPDATSICHTLNRYIIFTMWFHDFIQLCFPVPTPKVA